VPDPSWWYYPEFDHGSDTLSYHMIPADGGPGVLRVVDADSVRQLAEVQTPRNFEFVSGAVEPGGHRVVYVGLDDAVHRYDWRAARDQRVVEGRFALAAYSRDGRWIVTGRANGRVELWDAHTAAHMATFEGLGARITSVATSADGRWLAAADESGAVRLWGLECRCLVLMSGHRGRAFVRFDALGRHMVSNAADGTRLWDIASRTLVYSAQYAGVTVEQSRFSRDAGWIAHPGDARLAIHESATGRELFTLDGHAGAPTNVFFGEGGRHIATAGSDGRVVVWNTPRIPLIEFQHPVSYSQLYDSRQDDPSIAVAFSARGLLASGGMDGNVRLRDAATLRPQPDLAGDGSPISALAFNPDGTRLAVASEHSLRLYDGEGALLNAAALQRHVLAMRYAGSSMLMLALKNHGWALWDAQALRLRLGGERDQAGASGLSPDGTRFAYGWQGVVHLLDLRSGRELWTRAIEEAPGVPSRELAVLEFDTRGARLAVSSLRATTVVLDAADGRLLASARDDSSSELETLRFSPDGAALLITDGNRSARLWRWRQNDEHRLDAHSAPLRGGAFSADGALAFTWGQDGKVYAWDAAHGELLDRVGFHAVNLAFDSVAVDPGDQRLASASIDGIVRVWDISRETRDAAALAVQLRCRAPWTVRETELVSQPPAGGCESRADLAPD
jgi:WD40 repeat protein